jgi:transcriptional regulator with PAS, ATPase and Fis domain
MIVGPSKAMHEVMKLVEKIAPAEKSTVLIEGETGTGKGVLARSIHELSPRREGPFVNVTCSALLGSLLESELFGHEKGAFTDAHTMKRGLVEVATGGTLFLDEIAELPTNLQGKLLRLIEEKAFRRVGGTVDLTVDARVIAATNRDLEADVASGEFRQDLYYRLRVIPVTLPPLRHRRPDIPGLAKTFIERFSRELGMHIEGIDAEAMSLLEKHTWPGNVRELRNVIERAVLLSEGPILTPDLLPVGVRNGAELSPRREVSLLGPDGLNLESLERNLLREALQRAQGNRTEAGRLLGLSRHQIRNRLIKYGGEP